MEKFLELYPPKKVVSLIEKTEFTDEPLSVSQAVEQPSSSGAASATEASVQAVCPSSGSEQGHEAGQRPLGSYTVSSYSGSGGSASLFLAVTTHIVLSLSHLFRFIYG